jgi:hypothetical protein
MKLYIVELENGLISGVNAESMVQLFNDTKENFYQMLIYTLGHYHIDNLELEWVKFCDLEEKYKEKRLTFNVTE